MTAPGSSRSRLSPPLGLCALVVVCAQASSGCGSEPAKPAPARPISAAEAQYPDLSALWTRSISRSCGPNSGVCHNNLQFPSFQTKSAMLRTIGEQCNQMRSNPATIDNVCEQPGDWLVLGEFQTRIGSVVTDDPGQPTKVTITLHDPLPAAAPGAKASFRHTPPGATAVELPIPEAALMGVTPGARTLELAYAPLNDPETSYGLQPGDPLAAFLVPYYYEPGSNTAVILGDPNGDGVFGAELGGSLITPGDPLKSYLFLRVASPLAVGPGAMMTNVGVPASSEAQMPIANTQHWDIENALPALWCWIQGLEPDGANADGPIDHAGCDLSAFPTTKHEGVWATTFSSIYSQTLKPSCAGPCHHSGTSVATTLFMDDEEHTFNTLLGLGGVVPSEPSMGLPYVMPNAPGSSYLYLKMTGAPSLTGTPMPPSGLLPQSEIDAVGTWISQGANRY